MFSLVNQSLLLQRESGNIPTRIVQVTQREAGLTSEGEHNLSGVKSILSLIHQYENRFRYTTSIGAAMLDGLSDTPEKKSSF